MELCLTYDRRAEDAAVTQTLFNRRFLPGAGGCL
jgi:hypothetical protein